MTTCSKCGSFISHDTMTSVYTLCPTCAAGGTSAPVQFVALQPCPSCAKWERRWALATALITQARADMDSGAYSGIATLLKLLDDWRDLEGGQS